MYTNYELVDMEEINGLLEQLVIEDINEELNTSLYCEDTQIL